MAGWPEAMLSTKVAPRVLGDTPVVRIVLPLISLVKSLTNSSAVALELYEGVMVCVLSYVWIGKVKKNRR